MFAWEDPESKRIFEWDDTRLSKTYFMKYKQFPVAHFNIGNLATLMIYDEYDVKRWYHNTKGCIDRNIDVMLKDDIIPLKVVLMGILMWCQKMIS